MIIIGNENSTKTKYKYAECLVISLKPVIPEPYLSKGSSTYNLLLEAKPISISSISI